MAFAREAPCAVCSVENRRLRRRAGRHVIVKLQKELAIALMLFSLPAWPLDSMNTQHTDPKPLCMYGHYGLWDCWSLICNCAQWKGLHVDVLQQISYLGTATPSLWRQVKGRFAMSSVLQGWKVETQRGKSKSTSSKSTSVLHAAKMGEPAWESCRLDFGTIRDWTKCREMLE